MSHQNIIDLRELICTIERLTSATILQITTLKQSSVSPFNNTQNASARIIDGIADLESRHTAAIENLSPLINTVNMLSNQPLTADTNIHAFRLYEQLLQWQNQYTRNIANKLRGISN